MAEIDQLYKRAEEAFQKRNYDYARDLFLNILALNLDHAESRKALKATLLRKFQEQGATSKIRLIAMKGKIEVELRTTKDLARRADICQRFLSDDPGNSKVRCTLADILLQLNCFNGAAVEAEMAMADDPKNVPSAKILATALTKLGKVKEAQSILEKVSACVKEDRDLERLQRDLAAMQTMKAGFEEAKSYRDVIKDKDQAAKLEIQHHLIQTEEQFQAVVQDLEGQMSENPTDSRVPRKIGDLYFDKKKDYKTAQEHYRKASQLAPQDSILRDKIDDCAIRLHDDQIEQAQKAADPKLNEYRVARLKFVIQSYERRVQDRPTDMGLRFELARGYYQAGPHFLDRAIAEFQHAVKDPKKKPESHYYLGLSFQKKGKFDLADKQYEQAEGLILSTERKLEVLYQRAKCNAEAGKIPKAVELGKLILEQDIGFKDISQLLERWENGQS